LYMCLKCVRLWFVCFMWFDVLVYICYMFELCFSVLHMLLICCLWLCMFAYVFNCVRATVAFVKHLLNSVHNAEFPR
jgi:hypothetical protein